MKSIRIVLLDGDRAFLRAAESYLAARRELHVLAALADGREGLRLIRREQPDVVLLGLVLQGVDGYTVLREVRRFARPPLVIVCTEFCNELTQKVARKYGAAYFLCRPIELHCLYSAVIDTCAGLRAAQTETAAGAAGGLSAAGVRQALAAAGFSLRHSGCHYLAEAICRVAEAPAQLRNLTRGVYAEIAAEHRVALPCVERCIRAAIAAAFARGGLQPHSDVCPTNRDYIRTMAELLLAAQAQQRDEETDTPV